MYKYVDGFVLVVPTNKADEYKKGYLMYLGMRNMLLCLPPRLLTILHLQSCR